MGRDCRWQKGADPHRRPQPHLVLGFDVHNSNRRYSSDSTDQASEPSSVLGDQDGGVLRSLRLGGQRNARRPVLAVVISRLGHLCTHCNRFWKISACRAQLALPLSSTAASTSVRSSSLLRRRCLLSRRGAMAAIPVRPWLDLQDVLCYRLVIVHYAGNLACFQYDHTRDGSSHDLSARNNHRSLDLQEAHHAHRYRTSGTGLVMPNNHPLG